MDSDNSKVWTVGNEAVIVSVHKTREAALAALDKLGDTPYYIQETTREWVDFVRGRE